MKGFIQKYKTPLIVFSCALFLFGLPLKQPAGFIVFCIPGILLGLVIFLITKGSSPVIDFAPKKKENTADELLKWQQLKEKGAISEEEFQSKKKQLLE
jgi:hypothetical protein